MAVFDVTKAYAPQEDTFFDDGREIKLLHAVYSRPDINKLRGSPAKVLAAIDDFGRECYLMNVGQDKGAIVTKLIAQSKPRVMVELGGYVGYSAILFANAVRQAGGRRYYCLERNPEFAAVVSSLVDLAGLASFVKVVVGSSSDSLRRLHAEAQLEQIDFLFLDHYKPAYLPDLKLCEQLGLIRHQTVLAADNVIKPGNPPYLEYVRSSVEKKRQGTAVQSSINGIGERQKSQAVEKMDCEIRGDPNLIYSSRLMESFEPTGIPQSKPQDGVEITRCVGTAL
ncbi:hypothetical protein CDD82_7891 [Ophiocordyceps australis]|uniref:catechol O-methyltransferase n=1 Tax=Ophiocordyceps australis TaxID=1399860 RepID=A0A2C5ZIJ0_9HYPO|nr:hypothetical protein CDD82_7891 [Ophiocordyceps australis]